MAEIVPLAEAVRELVHDGDIVALEGFTHLIPHAAGHELDPAGTAGADARADDARRRLRPADRHGCARKLVFSWGGNPGVGSLHRFRDAVEQGWPAPLELEEHSHAGMAAALRGRRGEAAVRRRSRVRGHGPAERTSVAWIDVPVHRRGARRRPGHSAGRRASSTRSRPTRRGTSSSGGSPACRRRPCSPPRRSLVTVEEIVPRARAATRRASSCRRGPSTRVCLAPGGAHPSYAHGYYDRDNAFYVALGRDQPRPGRFREWMRRHVLDDRRR